jgi:hypothetical protein
LSLEECSEGAVWGWFSESDAQVIGSCEGKLAQKRCIIHERSDFRILEVEVVGQKLDVLVVWVDVCVHTVTEGLVLQDNTKPESTGLQASQSINLSVLLRKSVERVVPHLISDRAGDLWGPNIEEILVYVLLSEFEDRSRSLDDQQGDGVIEESLVYGQ